MFLPSPLRPVLLWMALRFHPCLVWCCFPLLGVPPFGWCCSPLRLLWGVAALLSPFCWVGLLGLLLLWVSCLHSPSFDGVALSLSLVGWCCFLRLLLRGAAFFHLLGEGRGGRVLLSPSVLLCPPPFVRCSLPPPWGGAAVEPCFLS